MIADWSDVDERVRAAKYLARRLEDARYMPTTEAAAYAFRVECDVPVSRTAEELGVSEQRVYNATTDVRQRVEDMRETLDVIDAGSGELPMPDQCEACGDALDEWTLGGDGEPLCPDCAGVETDG